MRSTHAQRLERWLGAEQVTSISDQMREWYGPPVPVSNVPGSVWAGRGGEFMGPIAGGGFAGLTDYYRDRVRRIARNFARKQQATCHAGFASFTDLMTEAVTNGKAQYLPFVKSETAGSTIAVRTSWTESGYPAAGSAPAARPGGAIPDNTTAGGFLQKDPNGTDTLHLTSVISDSLVSAQTLILYDRLFHASGIAHTNNASQTVTGTPTRYNTTASAPGTFFFLEVTSTLGTTAHTVLINYTDNSGNAAENSGTTSIVVSSTGGKVPHAQFFVPINVADTGILAITALTFSAVSSGTSNAVLGKVLTFVPQPYLASSGVPRILDGIKSAFNLVEVKTDACLAFLELKGSTNVGGSYCGMITLVSG
jgi:hypothetical protein